MLKYVGIVLIVSGVIGCSFVLSRREKKSLTDSMELLSFLERLLCRVNESPERAPGIYDECASDALRQIGFPLAFAADPRKAVSMLTLPTEEKNGILAYIGRRKIGDANYPELLNQAIMNLKEAVEKRQKELPNRLKTVWTVGLSVAALCMLLLW